MGWNRMPLMVCMLCWLTISYGQGDYYFVSFVGKECKEDPRQFLSLKSIQRRVKQHIPLHFSDYPVNAKFVSSLKEEARLEVVYVSKWLNGILVKVEEQKMIKKFPFVSKVEKIGGFAQSHPVANLMGIHKQEGIEYGASAYQNGSLGADHMHEMGYNGKGRLIAVFDGGFQNANNVPSLQHLFTDGQLVFTHNVVDKTTDVFFKHPHGTNVLSTLAAYAPGKLVGLAYGASYALFITEDIASESKVEEYYWLKAAEMADSIGVDIISSSLGYNVFDNQNEDHSLSELDGKTTVITRAAQAAAQKGILVVNSAGNNYNEPKWRNVVFPADGDSVLAVGAVDTKGNRAGFSAVGPTADNRIKPNVSAFGVGVVINSTGTNFTTGSGTSYSAPLVAGLAAGLWQVDTSLTNMQLFSYIQQSATLYCNPNNEIGHGIPDFTIAYQLIKERKNVDCASNGLEVVFYPNPVKDLLTFNKDISDNNTYQLYDASGMELESGVLSLETMLKLELDFSHLVPGIYLLRIGNRLHKVIKL